MGGKNSPPSSESWGGSFYFPPTFRRGGGDVEKTLPPHVWGGIINYGVCRALLPMLHPPWRFRPHSGTRFPAQTIQCHVRSSIKKNLPRRFHERVPQRPTPNGQTNRQTFHADIVFGDYGLASAPTEVAPLAR